MLTLRRLHSGDWQRLRDVRLRALASDGDAFYSTLERERRFGEEEWRRRLSAPGAATFVLHDGDGRDVGLAASHPAREGEGGERGAFAITAMWVEETTRGAGGASRLLDAAVAHAEARGASEILLWVAQANAPARRLYARHGFTPTGRTGAFPPPRNTPELELRRSLSAGTATGADGDDAASR